MPVENVFPPIPSELIMPLAGYPASHEQLNVAPVVVAGTIGSVAGAVLWRYLSLSLGERVRGVAGRHGRWVTITPGEGDHARGWFGRHGRKAVFLGRLVPAFRTLTSGPAGIAEMNLTKLLIHSTAGTVLWTGLLALAGYLLGSQYQQVSTWLSSVTNVVVVGLVAWYLYRVVTSNPKTSG